MKTEIHHPEIRRARKWLMRASQWAIQGPPAIDFQMHTRWTDGQGSVREMIDAASAAGLKAIAITEHCNFTSDWYPEFVAEVKAQRTGAGLPEIYYGVEVAAIDYLGGLKADVARLDTELVLGVVHRYPKETGGFWDFKELSAAEAVHLEIRALTGLAANPLVDVIGHPGGAAYRKFGAFPITLLEPVIRVARDNDIAVEVNTKYLWDKEGLFALLNRFDPLVSFGSDAHTIEEVGSNLGLYQSQTGKRKGNAN